jgi:hypothetical protein
MISLLGLRAIWGETKVMHYRPFSLEVHRTGGELTT